MAPSPKYSAVVIDSDPDSLQRIVQYIKALGDKVEVSGFATLFEKGFELIRKSKPSVVVLEIGDDIEMGIKRINSILDHFPQTAVFATSKDKSSDTILKVMKAGADEYILRPIVEADIVSAFQKHGRLWLTKPPQEKEVGSVYMVFSPKGGVGSTTIAINLATQIHDITKKKTLLMDLDLTAGDVSTFLNLKPSYSISDVTANISKLDKSFLMGVLTRHESGIYVLAEPQKIAEAASISGSDIKRVLELLQTMFDYIVIDTESVLDERAMSAIEISDTILLVFVMSLPGIKNIQRYLRYFEDLGLKRDRVKLIVNRYLKKGDIRLEDAEKALNYPISFAISNDYNSTMECLNKGLPLSMCNPRSKVNIEIRALAESLIRRNQKGE